MKNLLTKTNPWSHSRRVLEGLYTVDAENAFRIIALHTHTHTHTHFITIHVEHLACSIYLWSSFDWQLNKNRVIIKCVYWVWTRKLPSYIYWGTVKPVHILFSTCDQRIIRDSCVEWSGYLAYQSISRRTTHTLLCVKARISQCRHINCISTNPQPQKWFITRRIWIIEESFLASLLLLIHDCVYAGIFL